MKKFLIALFIAIFSVFSSFAVACSDGEEGNLTLYVPDGAPALSVARLLAEEDILPDIDINVVLASTIRTYVTGETPTADICILPVNEASQFLGDASTYTMLGSVTQGNLFIMKKQSGVDITTANLNELIGKKVGVINLANVPGLTFKSILSDNAIPFANYVEGFADATKVNLVALSGGQDVSPTSACDYFVVPEPAATNTQTTTQGKLSIAGSLQTLYGDGNGYSQAVIVAKNSVIAERGDLIQDLLDEFADNKEWLLDENTTKEEIVNAVISGFVDSEMRRTFTANNLNDTVINNCAINFVKASACKTAVLGYLAKINAITNDNFGTPVDAFFAN